MNFINLFFFLVYTIRFLKWVFKTQLEWSLIWRKTITAAGWPTVRSSGPGPRPAARENRHGARQKKNHNIILFIKTAATALESRRKTENETHKREPKTKAAEKKYVHFIVLVFLTPRGDLGVQMTYSVYYETSVPEEYLYTRAQDVVYNISFI